ncbi:MAG: HAMP domain-containing histidine kinase [Chloroflexota bacterium]|nr:HAMP domain-containing histidine kinase [Chloroflexota bacterium]
MRALIPLSFRVRLLLLALVVALPPLVAFGFVTLRSTAALSGSFRQNTADGAADRALRLLAARLSEAEAELAVIARRDELRRAVYARNAGATHQAYAQRPLAGWSAAVVTSTDSRIVDAAVTGVVIDLRPMQRLVATGRSVRGPLVADQRMIVFASVPIGNRAEDSRTSTPLLVAWRDETSGLLADMAVAAGGGVTIQSRSGAVSSGSTLDDTAAGTELTMADGSSGRLVAASEVAALDFAALGLAPMLLTVGAAAALWAVILAMAFARSVGRQMSGLAEAAERVGRGEYHAPQPVPASPTARDELARLSAAHAQLARALEVRNRQIGEVATQIANLPMGGDATDVARAISRAAARVTGVAKWHLAVLRSSADELLPPGCYSNELGTAVVAPGHLERLAWSAVTTASHAGVRAAEVDDGARRCVVALVATGGEFDAVLIGPWAGRKAPSAGELNLFALLGQHAGTAIAHALLYARVGRQADELRRLSALQADFLRGVTHDLQTPLTSIAALAAEARALGGVPEPVISDLRSIAEQADRLRRMVGQLLTVSRLGARGIQPRQEVVRVAPLVVRTWQALRARDRRLELRPPVREHLLVADADRLEQVLWALLDNAVKYSPARSPITVRLCAEDRRENSGQLQPDATPSELVGVIEVVDEGIGMDPDTAARAFDQFHRSDEARRLAPDGSGIGLYAARGLVIAMGGTIQIVTGESAGTTVAIRLPAETVTDADRDTSQPVTAAAVSAPG